MADVTLTFFKGSAIPFILHIASTTSQLESLEMYFFIVGNSDVVVVEAQPGPYLIATRTDDKLAVIAVPFLHLHAHVNVVS